MKWHPPTLLRHDGLAESRCVFWSQKVKNGTDGHWTLEFWCQVSAVDLASKVEVADQASHGDSYLLPSIIYHYFCIFGKWSSSFKVVESVFWLGWLMSTGSWKRVGILFILLLRRPVARMVACTKDPPTKLWIRTARNQCQTRFDAYASNLL